MTDTLSGKPQLSRKINAALIFGLIQRAGPLSRVDIARRTGIRATSVSAIVQALVDDGLLREIGHGPSTGGRQPVLYDVNPTGLHAAGIEIAEDEVNGVLLNLSADVLSTRRTPLPDTRVETVIETICDLLRQLCSVTSLDAAGLAALGITVPGIIAKERGEVVLSRPLGWRAVPLQRLLQERTGLHTFTMNNAQAGAMTAYYDAPSEEVRSLLYVLVNLQHGKDHTITSLGCGIAQDGRPYFGEGEIAGELRVDIEHPFARARNVPGVESPSSLRELVAAGLASDERFAPVWNAFAEDVARVVAAGMDFLSPGKVVVGSDLVELGDLIGSRLQSVVRARTVAGLLSELEGTSRVHVGFQPVHAETLARGAVLPRLHAPSLSPMLRDSLMT